MNFNQRIYVPEEMEEAFCDRRKLWRTYQHLATINRTISRMDGLLREKLLEHAKRIGTAASVLEVGCGGGDILARLAREARQANLKLQLVGIDTDARAIAFARERFDGNPMLQFNVGSLENVGGRFDYVFCNHVLHHIAPADLVPFLRRLFELKRRRLLINDLERSRTAYALYTVLAGLTFHRSFVFGDGRLSIRKGFQASELRQACAQAGFPVHVQRLFPWRLVLTAETAG